MIKKYSEIKESFKKYLDNLIEETSEFEDFYEIEGFNYSYLKEDLDNFNDDNIIVFVDKDENIINFATRSKEESFDAFYLDKVDIDILRENLEDLKENFSHPIVSSMQEFYKKDNGFSVFEMNRKSKIISEDYLFMDNYFCLNKDDMDIFVNLSDEKNFPQYEGNLLFEIMDYDSFVSENMRNDKFVSTSTIDDTHHNHIAGFHYFGQFDERGDKMIVAKDGDNIVGMIKYGEYGGDYAPRHIGLCFIDVKKPYRGQGIATLLMEEFGKRIEKENKFKENSLPIYLTDESDMGRKCHMKDIAIDKIKNVPLYYEDHSDYSYVSFFNGKEIGRSHNYKELFPEKQKEVESFEI